VARSEIDPKKLKQMQSRFERLSHDRLQKMLAGFGFSQSDGIKLLNLLFHVNHPMLPGYVDKSTPCGIPNYFPTALEKKIAKTVSRSFKFESRAYLKFEIAALYLMGSTGTLGQSIRSDLDLWVCLSEPLPQKQLAKLHKKSQLISRWMATLGVELNCYLVQQDEFSKRKQKNLSKESCGDTQNYLLLDEFYRTAIWVCGRQPLWWLIAPQDDYCDMASRLLEDKHIDPADWIDFGEVVEIPAEEYFSAALWQLYKAVGSPYKSSVKLLILEIYARYFPQTGLLSTQYKSLVYQGDVSIDQLDPYRMILQYAENFLQQQPQRLEFLRRAFYLKAGSAIKLGGKKPDNWRKQEILQLVRGWGWPQSRLDYLNARPHWKIGEVLKEHDDLVRELTHSYHFLSSFARVQGVLDKVSQKELKLLGRKLYAVFERRAGKIDRVNNGIARDVTETSVTLYQTTPDQWCLISGRVNQNQLVIRSPLYKSRDFFQMLSWCVCNQVVDRATLFQIYSEQIFYSAALAEEMVKALLRMTADHQLGPSDAQFEKVAETTQLGVYLNSEHDPLEEDKSRGVYQIVDNPDWFCWGEPAINLLSQFNIFYVNSWGEYNCKNYQGEFAWVQLFQDQQAFFDRQQQYQLVICGNLPNADKVKPRIQALFEKWRQLLLASKRRSIGYTYLMSVAGGILRLDLFQGEFGFRYFKQHKKCLYSLGDRTNQTVEFQVDDNLALGAPLKRIITKPLRDEYDCYLMQRSNKRIDVVLKSPQGHLFYQSHHSVDLKNLVSHYQQFIDSVTRHQALIGQDANACHFWHLPPSADPQQGRFRKIKESSGLIASEYRQIQAIATFNSDNKICFDLYTADQVCLYRDYRELVYRQLAKSILQQRSDATNYPIFITDLDLSISHQPLTLVAFFEHKREIERKLNRALEQLGKHGSQK